MINLQVNAYMDKIGFLLLTAIAVPCSAQTAPKIEFASAKIDNIELRAVTRIEWRKNVENVRLPHVGSIECYGQSPDVEFTMNSQGALASLWFHHLGDPDEDGDRNEITFLGDHLWLYIDGKRFEFRNILRPNDHFSNVDYSVKPTGGDVIMTVPWIGHPAVRENSEQPWMHISLIYDRIISAKRLKWSFKSREWSVVDDSVPENRLPNDWKTKRYNIDIAGMKESITWCASQIASAEARALPAKLLDELHAHAR